MKLPELPQGSLFVTSSGRGKTFMDSSGNLYVREPAPAVLRESDPLPCSQSPRGFPGEVALPAGGSCVVKESATRALPSMTLSAQTVDYLRAETRWLESETVEHFIGFSVDEAGSICGRIHRTDRLPKSCTPGIPSVVKESQGQHAKGLICLHNHPRAEMWNAARQRHEAGAVEPSPADREFTSELRESLHQAGIVLLDHLIVGPRALPHSFTEATQQPETEWDRRQRESQRLWSCYGGRPPWSR